MQVEGAVITEQGVTFAVVVVRRSVVNTPGERDQAIAAFSAELFDGLPVVLMAQESTGTPTYYGRNDLSAFMANVPVEAVPWQRFTFRQ
jgi:hypothetical protein